jgi:hypothetical protein
VQNTTPLPKKSLLTKLTGLITIPHLGLLTTSIAGRTDAAIVERTWGLLSVTPSRKEQFYGPRFTFREFFRARDWLQGTMMHYGITIFGLLLATCPPFRWALRRWGHQPGQGHEKEKGKEHYTEYRALANADPPAGKQAFGRAWFSGSQYLRSSPPLVIFVITPLSNLNFSVRNLAFPSGLDVVRR